MFVSHSAQFGPVDAGLLGGLKFLLHLLCFASLLASQAMSLCTLNGGRSATVARGICAGGSSLLGALLPVNANITAPPSSRPSSNNRAPRGSMASSQPHRGGHRAGPLRYDMYRERVRRISAQVETGCDKRAHVNPQSGDFRILLPDLLKV